MPDRPSSSSRSSRSSSLPGGGRGPAVLEREGAVRRVQALRPPAAPRKYGIRCAAPGRKCCPAVRSAGPPRPGFQTPEAQSAAGGRSAWRRTSGWSWPGGPRLWPPPEPPCCFSPRCRCGFGTCGATCGEAAWRCTAAAPRDCNIPENVRSPFSPAAPGAGRNARDAARRNLRVSKNFPSIVKKYIAFCFTKDKAAAARRIRACTVRALPGIWAEEAQKRCITEVSARNAEILETKDLSVLDEYLDGLADIAEDLRDPPPCSARPSSSRVSSRVWR